MNCKSVESRLSAYVDSELPGEEMLEIRDHLRCCLCCRQEETDLRSLKRLMEHLEDAEPPAGFEERLTAAVLCCRGEKRQPSQLASFVFLVGVAGGTMLATLFVLGTFTGRSQVADSPPRGPSLQRGIAFEVQRDMVTSSIDDPASGVPVMSSNVAR